VHLCAINDPWGWRLAGSWYMLGRRKRFISALPLAGWARIGRGWSTCLVRVWTVPMRAAWCRGFFAGIGGRTLAVVREVTGW